MSAEAPTVPIIDCDVHNAWRSSRDLLPYLDPFTRDCLERGELPGGRDSFPHGHRPWLHPEGFERTDAVPPDGGTPGSDYPFLCEQLLDRYDLEYAILTGDEAIEASTLANPYFASALVRATNDCTVDEWLGRSDPRLRASLVVAPQDPSGAAAEIRRLPASRTCSCRAARSGRTAIPSTAQSGKRRPRLCFRWASTSAARGA